MITGHLQLLITSALTRYNGLSLLALITLLVYLCEVDTGKIKINLFLQLLPFIQHAIMVIIAR